MVMIMECGTINMRTPAVSTFQPIKYIMTKYLSNEMTQNRGFWEQIRTFTWKQVHWDKVNKMTIIIHNRFPVPYEIVDQIPMTQN